MNPLGMVVALLGAMEHAATLNPASKEDIFRWTGHAREAMYSAFREGRGTRDLCGPSGLTTEKFVESVAADLEQRMSSGECSTVYVPPVAEEIVASRKFQHSWDQIDEAAMKKFFDKYDTNDDASISFDEFVDMTLELGIAPMKQTGVQKSAKRSANKSSLETPF